MQHLRIRFWQKAYDFTGTTTWNCCIIRLHSCNRPALTPFRHQAVFGNCKKAFLINFHPIYSATRCRSSTKVVGTPLHHQSGVTAKANWGMSLYKEVQSPFTLLLIFNGTDSPLSVVCMTKRPGQCQWPRICSLAAVMFNSIRGRSWKHLLHSWSTHWIVCGVYLLQSVFSWICWWNLAPWSVAIEMSNDWGDQLPPSERDGRSQWVWGKLSFSKDNGKTSYHALGG